MADLLMQQDPGIERKKRLAEAMIGRGQNYGPVQHWAQGLDRIASSLTGAYLGKQADTAEKDQRQAKLDKLSQVIADAGGDFYTLSQGLVDISPEMAMNIRIQGMQSEAEARRAAEDRRIAAEQAEQDRKNKLEDAVTLHSQKRQIDIENPKPETELDKLIKVMTIEKGQAEVEKKQREAADAAKSDAAQTISVQDALAVAKDLRNDPELPNIFGSFQGAIPSVRQGSVDAEAKRDRLINMLKVAERGKLKGQGTISDFEAKMLGDAISILNNPRIGDKAALAEVDRVIEMLEGKISTGQEAPQSPKRFKFNPATGELE